MVTPTTKKKNKAYEPGGWALQPPQTRANPSFFGQKLNFSGRNRQPRMKQTFFVFITRKKTEFILSSEIKCPKSGFLLLITGWGESGKVILQVSIAVFWRHCHSPSSLEKIGQYTYENNNNNNNNTGNAVFFHHRINVTVVTSFFFNRLSSACRLCAGGL